MESNPHARSTGASVYKELIGIAVSGATHCRYCAYFHTEAAKLFGATVTLFDATTGAASARRHRQEPLPSYKRSTACV